MNKTFTALALTGTLALGGLAGYGLSHRSAPATAEAASPSTIQGTMVQALATPTTTKVPTYTDGHARTESEANTVQVVKARRDGLVYVSVTESNTASPQAQLRKKLQDQMPFGFTLPDDNSAQGDQQATGTGSGFFVNSNGDIITNNHVVEGASTITIRVHGDKKEYKAKVIARAPDFDLALIRAEGIPAGSIKPLPLGDSSKLDVGLKAIAMGAPFGLDFSVSEGIISSLERKAPVGSKEVEQSVIQTDAAINPGNSGGPLLNSAGEVIGVNTQILTGGIGQSAGVGFAIPVNTVKKLLPQLQVGTGNILKTPSLGIQFTDLSQLNAAQLGQYKLPSVGALVQKVYPNSPAANAGLKGGTASNLQLNSPSLGNQSSQNSQSSSPEILIGGDIITAIDGQKIEAGDDLRRSIIGKQFGDSVKLSIQRAGQSKEVTVKLTAFDFPAAQQ